MSLVLKFKRQISKFGHKYVSKSLLNMLVFFAIQRSTYTYRLYHKHKTLNLTYL